MQKIILQCIPQWGKLFYDVSHNGKNYSTMYPTMGKIILRCIPQWGKLFHDVCIPQQGINLFLEYLCEFTYENKNARRTKVMRTKEKV